MARLSKAQRKAARARAANAALLGHRQRARISYSQGSARWSGIDRKRNAREGEFPLAADCSAFVTWALWNALYLGHRKRDSVNGAAWRAGFTGTQIAHGRRVPLGARFLRGDLVFYANSGTRPSHVAIVVGRRNGKPMVVSHGSSSGPLFLPWNYRRVIAVKRYIHKGI